MPNYDFKCQSCGHKFSKQVAVSERGQVNCPVCGQETKQLLTWNGFVKKSNDQSCPSTGCGSSGFS